MLSGGLDSSLVASVACRHVRDHPDSGRFSAFPRIHSFSVGLAGSPDIKVSRVVVYNTCVAAVVEHCDSVM